PGLSLQLDAEVLSPVIDAAVERALVRFAEAQQKLNGKIAYSEAEAAALIGVEAHVLRDARREGDLPAFVIRGGRVRYLAKDLIAYVTRTPWTQATKRSSGWRLGRARPRVNGNAVPVEPGILGGGLD